MEKTNRELFEISGRVAIITGSAGLLGPEYADALSEAGAHVVLTDVDVKLQQCQELAGSLRQRYWTNPTALCMDLFHKESIDEGVTRVYDRYGRIDILINNAVYNPVTPESQAPFEEYSLDIWNKVVAVNLTGVFLCTQAIGKLMLRQGHGVIVNISSVYGMVGADQRVYGTSGLNSSVAYAATKGALLNLTRYLAAYWHGKNIRVNSLSPGGVFNNQPKEFVENYCYRNMLHRMALPSDLRGAMLFLVSDASAFVTGANLVVDGGWTAW